MTPLTVIAAVIIHDNQVLIARRAPTEKHSGGWEFPGGKLEPSETNENCLKREIIEELGLELAVGELCTETIHDYGNFVIRLIAYYCTPNSESVKLSVHDRIKWTDVDKLLDYDLLPADVPIARKVISDHVRD